MNRIALLIVAVLSIVLATAGLTSDGEMHVAFDGSATGLPPYAGEKSPPLVDSEVLEQRAREPELIEEAIPSTTSTTAPATTTTAAPTATPTSQASESATGSTTASTSPPTTQPPPTTTTTEAGGFVASAENDFAARINSYRSSSGLPALSRSGSLDAYARSWAQKMAADGSLSHSNVGSLLGQWSAVGENVGVGYSVGSLVGAFVNSPEHESNISGDFTHVGIGVYQDADGALWTAHVFAR